MTTPRDIDAAIDGLDEALRAAGLPGLEAPADVAAIASIVEDGSAQHATLAFAEELDRHRPAAVASDIRPLG